MKLSEYLFWLPVGGIIPVIVIARILQTQSDYLVPWFWIPYQVVCTSAAVALGIKVLFT